jgi:hypothetical protein
MNLPTSQSVQHGTAMTNHAELIKFLEFQQKQIELLETHVRDLKSAYDLLRGSNNWYQVVLDSPKAEKPKTTPSQLAWQAPPPELRAQWRERAPRFRDGGIGREDWLMDRAACWAFGQCELKIQTAAEAELFACLAEIIGGAGRIYIDETKLRLSLAEDVRAARRPRPKSPNRRERIAAAITDGDERLALQLLDEALPND